MRQFYLTFRNGRALSDQLSWTHYRILLPLKSLDEINYYIHITETQSLSYRELKERIKSNEYERIGYKEEIKKTKVNTLIKNPIVIKTKYDVKDKISESLLHEYILNDMDNFLKELGVGFTYIGHEVKIKINNNYHSIDFLLYNYEFNLFIVCEIKVTKMKPEYIGQILKYINYVDKNIKKSFQDNTVGIIICKNKKQSLTKRNHLLKQQICFV